MLPVWKCTKSYNYRCHSHCSYLYIEGNWLHVKMRGEDTWHGRIRTESQQTLMHIWYKLPGRKVGTFNLVIQLQFQVLQRIVCKKFSSRRNETTESEIEVELSFVSPILPFSRFLEKTARLTALSAVAKCNILKIRLYEFSPSTLYSW